jgi:heptose-I-phosphate ethanolaminephosphotransferase
MFSKYKFVILFFLPFVVKIIVFVFLSKSILYIGADIIEDLVFSCLILFLLLNISVKFGWFKLLLLGVYIFYYVLEISSLLVTESNFSASYMYALLDSNTEELYNFFSNYFNGIIIFFILLLGIIYGFLLKLNYFSPYKIPSSIKVFGVVICLFMLKLTGYTENNSYYNIIRGSYGYYQLNLMIKSTSAIDSSKVLSKFKNDVLVVVIGESIARRHMQLYGYSKATNPLLNSERNDLMIFENVISPDVLTTKVVPKLLTSLSNNSKQEQPDNLIDILNFANFDTYWISNQRPIGFHENVISKLVSSVDTVSYLTHKSHLEKTNFDRVVLPELRSVLNNKGKKVIFIHLIGAHFNYGYRYPEKFNVFNSENPIEKQIIIDQYDNAILYNDFIVYSILNEVKSLKKKSAMLFLSDHGEDVFDESNFAGHAEGKLTKSMVEIPFFLWVSQDFDLPKDFEFDPNRKFMTDHLFSGMGHLLGIEYPSINKKESIFSESFQERKRIILDRFNYDHNENW